MALLIIKCWNVLQISETWQFFKTWKKSLAIDLGRLGSLGIRRCLDKETTRSCIQEKLYNVFFHICLWRQLLEYKGSFKKYIGSDNPVYVAQLQRMIAAKSECIAPVCEQTSTFQQAALSFYKYHHPNAQ